jgi:hypothetical protein
MSARMRITALAFVLAACAARPAGATCGAEGCPLDIRGPEVGAARFGFELGYQFVDQDKLWDGDSEAGTQAPDEHEVEVRTRTNSVLATGRAQFGDRVLVTSTLPYMDRFHSHIVEHTELVEYQYSGFGDLLTIGQVSVLGAHVHSPVSLSLRGGIKLPTGRTEVPAIDGEQPEPSARPGSGSTDWLAGFQARKLVGTKTFGGERIEMPISLSSTWRWNGQGTEDYQVGDEVQATLAGGWALSSPLRALLQLNFRHHDGDDPGESGDESHAAEGTSLYVTPGLQALLTNQMSAYGYVQIRAYEHTSGPELIAPYHLSFGLSYSLPQ